eukprot:m.180215 g.180215  ORF g.180215 m.180215 type:complete len:82 (-) comp9990_c2_seq22:1161-1406(-)
MFTENLINNEVAVNIILFAVVILIVSVLDVIGVARPVYSPEESPASSSSSSSSSESSMAMAAADASAALIAVSAALTRAIC